MENQLKNSSFNKDELKNINIKFDNEIVKPLEKSINLFEQKEPREKFFYIYVTPEDRKEFDVKGFCKVLFDCAYKNYGDNN